jgi:hypothetical protein
MHLCALRGLSEHTCSCMCGSVCVCICLGGFFYMCVCVCERVCVCLRREVGYCIGNSRGRKYAGLS